MAVKEQSFVLKRGEGLNDKNLIKHTVLETPRASSVQDYFFTPQTTPVLTGTGKADPKTGKPVPLKTSYVSPMARARQAKQRREAGASKDWDETSTSPSSETGCISNGTSTPAGTPALRLIPYSGGLIPSELIIPSSGYIPKSGNVPKSGSIAKSGEQSMGGSGRLPKFGVWDNQNNDENANPCYTLLFENVAQEKRIGGPIRIHAPPRPCSPATSEDLYNYNPSSIKAARKHRQYYHSLLCCFVGS